MTTLSKSQEAIKEAFGFQHYDPTYMDVQTGRLWDSLSLKAGETFKGGKSTELFNRAIDGRSLAETNMVCAGQLLAPEAFSTSRILFTFSRQSADEDVFSIAEIAAWSLWIGRKFYARSLIIAMRPFDNMIAPIRICNFCRAVYVREESCPGCGAREFKLTDIAGTIDSAGKQFLMDLNNPLVIESNMHFHLSFESGFSYVVKNPLRLWCHLEGLHARGVQ